MKTPKKYECEQCGFISNRRKTFKIGSLGFATCFKCGSNIKERAEWQEWLREEQSKIYGE